MPGGNYSAYIMINSDDPDESSLNVPVNLHVLGPQYSPIIENIIDVPGDQGGRVYLSFVRSYYDDDPLNRLTEGYSIQRSDTLASDNATWITIQSGYAYGDSIYTYEVQTLIDSSSSDNGLTAFRVIAATNEGNFASETVSGYSVDNIHPTTPSEVNANHSGNNISLNWQYELEEDFNYFEIIGLGDTTYSTENNIEFNLSHHYDEERIQSIDINDNKSEYSESVMSIKLHAGANLVSINVESEDTDISSVLSSLGNNITAAIGEGVAANNMEGNWMGSLDKITSCEAYWLIVNEEDILLVTGYPTDRTIPCELHAGNNLIGYPYRYASSIEDALPEDIGCDISGIIGEGVAAICNESGWTGSLEDLSGSYGYWFVADEAISIIFDGCDHQENCMDMARVINSPIQLQEGYEYSQSTEQVFYFIDNIQFLDGTMITDTDWILCYNGDKLIGARQWSGMKTDVPVMGEDSQESTQGYAKKGDVPIFKVLREDGSIVTLAGEIPPWLNNQLFLISSLKEALPIPKEFSLSPAYPNPFNPITTINYALPVDSDVSVIVYDLQGRETAILVDNQMKAGYHSIIWNADTYSSGIYFLSMNTNDFRKTQKLMLVK